MANFLAINSGLNSGIASVGTVGGYLNGRRRNEIAAQTLGLARQKYDDERADTMEARLGMALKHVEGEFMRPNSRFATLEDAMFAPENSTTVAQLAQYSVPDDMMEGTQFVDSAVGEDGKVRFQVRDPDGTVRDAGVAIDRSRLFKNAQTRFAYTGYGRLTQLAESLGPDHPELQQVLEQRAQLAEEIEQKLGITEEELANAPNEAAQLQQMTLEQAAEDRQAQQRAQQQREKQTNIGKLPGAVPDPNKIRFPETDNGMSMMLRNYYDNPPMDPNAADPLNRPLFPQTDMAAAPAPAPTPTAPPMDPNDPDPTKRPLFPQAASAESESGFTADELAMNAFAEQAAGDTSPDMDSMPSTDLALGPADNTPVTDDGGQPLFPGVVNTINGLNQGASNFMRNPMQSARDTDAVIRDTAGNAVDSVKGWADDKLAKGREARERGISPAELHREKQGESATSPKSPPSVTQIARGEAVPQGSKVAYAPGKTVTTTRNSSTLYNQMARPLDGNRTAWAKRAALYVGAMSGLQGGEITPVDKKIMQNIAETGSPGGIAMARIRASQMQSLAWARKNATAGMSKGRKEGRKRFGDMLEMRAKSVFKEGKNKAQFAQRGIGVINPAAYEAWGWAGTGKNGQKLYDAGFPMEVVNVGEDGKGTFQPRWEDWTETDYTRYFEAIEKSMRGHNTTDFAVDIGPLELFPQTTVKTPGELDNSIVGADRRSADLLNGLSPEQVQQMAESQDMTVEELKLQLMQELMLRDEAE